MIVDTSALLAILKGDPDAEDFALAFERAEIVRISAVTYLEACLLVDALRKPELSNRFDTALEDTKAVFEPLTLSRPALLGKPIATMAKAVAIGLD